MKVTKEMLVTIAKEYPTTTAADTAAKLGISTFTVHSLVQRMRKGGMNIPRKQQEGLTQALIASLRVESPELFVK